LKADAPFFEQDHRPVPSVDFDYGAVDRDAAIEDLQAALDYQKRKIPEMLELIVEALLSENLDADRLKKNALYFGYVARRKPFASQLELAAHLKITPSAVNQGIGNFCQKFPIMARLREASEELLKSH
jgi:hypothetical protein